MVKVLHLNGASGWGGNEQQLVDTLLSYAPGKVENLIYCLPDSALSIKALQLNCARLIFATGDKYQSKVNQKQLYAVVKSEKPDIIHIHTSNGLTLFFFAFMFKTLPVKVVFSKKGMGSSMSILSKWKYNFYKIDCIICVSAFVLERMKAEVLFKRNRSKLIVITDGINEQRITSSGHDVQLVSNTRSVQLLNIANHTQAKDLSVLLDALQYLVYELKYTDFFVHQIGEFTRLTPALRTQITQNQLENYIKLYGFMEDASTAYKKADVFVITSKKEGGPSSIIEAMSQKTPVVTTVVGVVPQVITSGYNGIAVPVRNHEEIAKGIFKLATDPSLRTLFATRSHEVFLKDFTAQKTAEKTLAVYKKLLVQDL